MPLFEGSCQSPACPAYGYRQERYYATSDTPQKPCLECGGPTVRLLSTFGIVWTGVIGARYNDRDKDGASLEGHWMMRKKSSLSGKPEPVFIETWQQSREFAKAEGLIPPTQMPRNYEVNESGTAVKNSVGMPGCEV